jgi:hypothetical protein
MPDRNPTIDWGALEDALESTEEVVGRRIYREISFPMGFPNQPYRTPSPPPAPSRPGIDVCETNVLPRTPSFLSAHGYPPPPEPQQEANPVYDDSIYVTVERLKNNATSIESWSVVHISAIDNLFGPINYYNIQCCECKKPPASTNHVFMLNASSTKYMTICNNCSEHVFSYCNTCGYTYLRTDMKDSGHLCKTCADTVVCTKCGKKAHTVLCQLVDNKETLCHYCFEVSYKQCANCGKNVKIQHMLCSSFHYYCKNCGVPKRIHDYSYKPHPVFYYSKREGRPTHFFGFELEIEAPEDIAQFDYDDNLNMMDTELKQHLPDFCYGKTDSSIRCGFEIVSHPCTFAWLRENTNKLEQIFEWRKRGWRSYNTTTCGMHVHITKDAFTTTHLYKFLQFFKDNAMFIYRISQRKSKSNFNRWASLEHPGDESVVYKAKNKYGGPERHVAVNLNNDCTVEVRIFKGTLNPISFWKNIEFCEALFQFTRDNSIKNMDKETFVNYIGYNRKLYGNLYNFVSDKEYRLLAKGD